MKHILKKGHEDVSLYIFIQDSASTTGAGKTGLVYNTASLVAYYVRPLSNPVAISLVTQTVTGAHADGGFVEVDSVNMPGIYRLDIPDAVSATGVDSVVIMLKGASGMAPLVLENELVAFDPQDASGLGLSRIDATISSRSSQTSLDTVAGYIDTEIAAIKAKTDNLPADPADASDIAASFTTVNGTLTTINGKVDTIDTVVDAIKAKTDALPTDPADQSLIDTQIGALDTKLDTIITDIGAITIPTDIENAQTLLKYDLSTITGEADRSPLNALRVLRNKISTTETAGKLTVKKEDDTTNAWQADLATDAGAIPITGIEPV